jgi:hypothetical protein
MNPNSKKVEEFFKKIDNKFLQKVMIEIDNLTPEEKKVLLDKCYLKIIETAKEHPEFFSEYNISVKTKMQGGCANSEFGCCPPPNEKIAKMDENGTNCGAIIVNDARPTDIMGEIFDSTIPEASLVDDDDDDLIPVNSLVNSRYFARRMEFDDEQVEPESLVLVLISKFFIVMQSFMQNLSVFERYPSGLIGLLSLVDPAIIGLCIFIIMYITNFVRRGGRQRSKKQKKTKKKKKKKNQKEKKKK